MHEQSNKPPKTQNKTTTKRNKHQRNDNNISMSTLFSIFTQIEDMLPLSHINTPTTQIN